MLFMPWARSDKSPRHTERAVATPANMGYSIRKNGLDAAFFDRRASEWRREQDRLLLSIEEHQSANQTYLEEGVRLLELAQGLTGCSNGSQQTRNGDS